MKTAFYLVVNSKGSTRTTKTRPGLDWNEISIRCELSLPDTLFQRPQLTAEIKVDADKVSPMVIETELSNNIKEAIELHTGVPIKLLIEAKEKQ